MPAPDLPERQTLPVPGPGVVAPDGPGSGPVDAQPGRVDADKPSGDVGDREPVGKLSRVADNYLKSKGVDAHDEKEGAGLFPPSHFDIYVDREGEMFGVAKGEHPRFGRHLGPLPR